jgi:hypothetical protein
LEEHVASIFMVEEYAKQEIRVNRFASRETQFSRLYSASPLFIEGVDGL